MKEAKDNFRILPILSPVIIYFFIYNIVGVAIVAFISHYNIENFDNTWVKMLSTIAGIGCLFYVSRKDKFNFLPGNMGRLNSIKKCPEYLIPLFIALIGILLNVLFTYVGINKLSPSGTEAMRAQFMVSLPAGVILYGILVPIAEELIYRGLVYTRLKKSFPISLCVIVSSLMFGAYHGNIVQGLYGFIMGLLLVLAYEATGKIYIPVLSHGITNIVVFLITYDGEFLNRFVR